MSADLPAPKKCRFCPALIAWVPTRLGRKVALEPEPQPQGAWVVHQDPALGPTAYHYSPQAHAGMTRYRAHTERCRPPGEAPAATRRPDPTAATRRPDPTAALKFPKGPRRGEVGALPPLEQLLKEPTR